MELTDGHSLLLKHLMIAKDFHGADWIRHVAACMAYARAATIVDDGNFPHLTLLYREEASRFTVQHRSVLVALDFAAGRWRSRA